MKRNINKVFLAGCFLFALGLGTSCAGQKDDSSSLNFLAFNQSANILEKYVGLRAPELNLSGSSTPQLLSKSPQGEPGNNDSQDISLSADGTYSVFTSYADNLVPGYAPEKRALYLANNTSGEIELISRYSDGTPMELYHSSASISADGRFIAWNTSSYEVGGMGQIRLYDRITGTNTLVSRSPDGAPGDNDSKEPVISKDGRYIVYASLAENLAPKTGNRDDTQIIMYDVQTGVNRIVSITESGEQGDSYSWAPQISADGNFITYASRSYNLTDDDRHGSYGIYHYDVRNNRVRMIPANYPPYTRFVYISTPRISDDGRVVVYEAEFGWYGPAGRDDFDNTTRIFAHDMETEKTSMVSMSTAGEIANKASRLCGNRLLSRDGRYVFFCSGATNLSPEYTDTSWNWNFYRHDLYSGKTGLIAQSSLSHYSSGFISISDDGRFFSFTATTNGRKQVYLSEPLASIASRNANGEIGDKSSRASALNANGTYLAFESSATNLVPGDNNNQPDVFVKSLQTGVIERVSVHNNGTQGNNNSSYPNIDALGQNVVWYSDATTLSDVDSRGLAQVYLHNRPSQTTTLISLATDGTSGNGPSGMPSISADGNYVVFYSDATNLVPGDVNGKRDIFRYNIETGETILITTGPAGTGANGDSQLAGINFDGRYVVFESAADNLIVGDVNHKKDIFIYDAYFGITRLISQNNVGLQGNGDSILPNISLDGRYVIFESDSNNLTANDLNGRGDIFVHDILTGETTMVSVSSTGIQGNNKSGMDAYYSRPQISAYGDYAIFGSMATNLDRDDPDAARDIYFHNRITGETKVLSNSHSMFSLSGAHHESMSGDGRTITWGLYDKYYDAPTDGVMMQLKLFTIP